MDPIESIDPSKDTTFALMVAAQNKNHNIFFMSPEGININHNNSYFWASPVKVFPNKKIFYKKSKSLKLSTDDIDILFIRLDPPFNEKYLTCTWLLDQFQDRIFFMNSPSGIRTAQEKTLLLQFKDIVPDTCISSSKETLMAFARKYRQVILKPYNQFGGHGIFSFNSSDPNLIVGIELLTQKETVCCIIQPYIKDADNGDKRILLLNGDPLGAILRQHSNSDHRNNLFAGGSVKPCKINNRDLEIIQTIKPKLIELNLHFVGIDILGDYLVEINVTSPTCIQEMESTYKTQITDKIISYASLHSQKQSTSLL